MDRLTEEAPGLLVSRLTEGTLQLPEWPRVTVHYEGLAQDLISIAISASNGQMPAIYANCARMGWRGVSVDGGEREDMDCDVQVVGLTRDVLMRTIKSADWERISFAIQQQIGQAVWKASHLTQQDKDRLAFGTPSAEIATGESTAGGTMTSTPEPPPDAPPATESGALPSEAEVMAANAT